MSTFWLIAIAPCKCSAGLQNFVWAWAENQGAEEWADDEHTGFPPVLAFTTCTIDAKAEQRIWFVHAINSDGSRMALFGA